MRREDRSAGGGEPGRLAAPERRARRERQQHRQLGQQALHDVHREVGLGHGDVHVHPEHELAARDVLQLLDEPAVAVPRRDALILRARERMRAGAREPHAERLDGRRDAAPHGLEVAAQLVDVAAHDRGDLERALHQLGMRAAVERPAREHVGDLVEAGAELERGRVEQHELLLDAQRERLALAECMLRCARHRVSIAPRYRAATYPAERDRGRSAPRRDPLRERALGDDRAGSARRRRGGARRSVRLGARDRRDRRRCRGARVSRCADC